MKSRNQFDTTKEYNEYLRTYFAARAMQAILSNPEATRNRKEYGTAEYRVGVIAVQYADELIKQLENN